MRRDVISKRLRFEIFKRDAFACQYCGRKAPRVILHCDHVVPVSRSGKTTWENLVTACQDCNLGKCDVPLPHEKVAEIQAPYQVPEYWDILTSACDILVRRVDYFDPRKVFPLMQEAIEFGAHPNEIVEFVSQVETWQEFETVLSDFVGDGVPIRQDGETLQ